LDEQNEQGDAGQLGERDEHFGQAPIERGGIAIAPPSRRAGSWDDSPATVADAWSKLGAPLIADPMIVFCKIRYISPDTSAPITKMVRMRKMVFMIYSFR
jgi:hypothetical protein